jgi:hypothetical protein
VLPLADRARNGLPVSAFAQSSVCEHTLFGSLWCS